MQRTPADFEQVLAQLTEIDQWLASLGLDSHSRFRQYRDNIAEMLQLQRVLSAKTIHDQIATEGRETEILASFVEGMEVVDTILPLRNANIDIPIEVLKKAICGPVDAAKEDKNSNSGRNFMFELVVATAAVNAGLKPVLGQLTDVTFEFDGATVFVECKRVFSESKIEQRIRDGSRQLKERVKTPDDCGVVAISVTRTINSGDGYWHVSSLEQVDGFLDGKVREIIVRFEPLLKSIAHDKISAVFFYLATPVYVSNVGFTPCKGGIVYPMPGAKDQNYLRRLAATLRI